MTPKKLLQLLRLGENSQVEFKTDLQAVDSIGKHVCAFLNSAGGYIVCGVSDKGQITGVDITDARLLTFEKKLHDMLSPSSLVSVQRQQVKKLQVVIIEVPKGSDIPYSFRNVIYIRSGETTEVASSNVIRDMVLASGIQPIRWERRHSTADLEADLETEEVRRTVRDATATGRAWFNDTNDVVRTLEDLSVARYGRMTNAGDVLFTSTPARRLPQTRLRAYSYKSDKAGDTYTDMKSFEGPALTLFHLAYSFILRNTRTISRFVKGNPIRQDLPLYPEAAVREALINALAHRDYSSASGGIAIHVFPGRLEIWNSGGLPAGVSAESLGRGQLSVLRNPDIAHVLYLRGLMEKAGRGSVLMIQECKKTGFHHQNGSPKTSTASP
ncbi:MAG: RNA-binding domain-containing protein [Planctomycetaceae bacterium]